MRDVAVLDFGDLHDGENIDRAELLVDHRAIAEFRADAQIGFDERRQRRDSLARIDAPASRIPIGTARPLSGATCQSSSAEA